MLAISSLREDYRAGREPTDVVAEVLERIDDSEEPVWIVRVPRDRLLAAAQELQARRSTLPLYGIPFAVKDNIDVAGMPTSAGCPGFARVASKTAAVVQRLLEAGALLVGKTNMDQFATGLVGTRSPYGACAAVDDPLRVSGGSSSGSALAVALGQVAFALGTDTAGSGRVPAAFNGLVGLKPSRGLLSTSGVVPACASLDCVSVLSADVAGAAVVLDVAAAPDPADPRSRGEGAFASPRRGEIGVPLDGQVTFLEAAAERAWVQALAHAGRRWTLVPVDVAPLLDAAPLLYEAWVAERTADIGEAVAEGPAGLNAVVAEIVRAGGELAATDVFAAEHRLAALGRPARELWRRVDALLLPTTSLHPTRAQVEADPVAVNSELGRYTNFVNLMDLCAIALPGPRRDDGLPFGVTLHAPWGDDRRLLELGCAWREEGVPIAFPGLVPVAVAGAHMSGMPLNDRLTGRGGRLLARRATAPAYRLFELSGDGAVARPGLVRVGEHGAAIDLEVWEIAPSALGELLVEVPPPLAIGSVELDDGSWVKGFVCEAHGGEAGRDITAHGGWRAYTRAEPAATA
jgi:allophanate hydrolase